MELHYWWECGNARIKNTRIAFVDRDVDLKDGFQFALDSYSFPWHLDAGQGYRSLSGAV